MIWARDGGQADFTAEEEVEYKRMNRWIAQQFKGELLRNKNNPVCSCHQALPISPDVSGPHAVRGLLCDPFLKR